MIKLTINMSKIIGYMIAVLIVIIAITVSILHFIAPNLDKHKVYFQNWAEKVLDSPVTIGSIHVHWNGLIPAIDFNQVTLYQQSSRIHSSLPVELLKIHDLHVGLNLWYALFTWTLQPSFIQVNGITLNVKQNSTDDWSINGYPIRLPHHQINATQDVNLSNIVQLLGKQRYLGISNVDVNLQNIQGKVHHIYFYHLSLRNSGDQHNVLGSLCVNQAVTTDANLGITVKGDLSKIEEANILVYLDVKNLQIEEWWKGKIQNYMVGRGTVSGQAWLHWSKAGAELSQANIDVRNMEVESLNNHKTIPLHQFQGHLAWQIGAQQSSFIGEKMHIVVGSDQWPETGFFLQLKSADQQQSAEQLLKIEYLDLADLHSMISSADLLPTRIDQVLDRLQLSGQITGFMADHHGNFTQLNNNDTLQMNLDNVTMLHSDELPGLLGLSGRLMMTPYHGNLMINTPTFIVEMPSLFSHSINLGQLSANIDWQQDSVTHDWRLTGNDIAAVNSDAALYGQFSMIFPRAKMAPRVSMLFGFHEKNPVLIQQYLPEDFLRHTLSDWLNKAFISGDPVTGTFILNGNLHDYPFKNKDGTFLIDTAVNNLSFEYAAGWPMLSHATGELIFQDDAMIATLSGGQLYDTTINSLNATIPEVGAPTGTVLNIVADTNSSAENILKFLQESPLKDSIGKNLNMFSAVGPVRMKLGLIIPLRDIDQTQVNGSAVFHHVNFNMPALSLNFKKSAGQLDFTQSSLFAKGIQSEFFGAPTIISLKTKQDDKKQSVLNISLDGHADIANLVAKFNLAENNNLVSKILQGSFSYQAEINLYLSNQTTESNKLLIKSDLKGLRVSLPSPFNKSSEQLFPSSMQMTFGQQSPINLWINYGNNFSSAVSFKENQQKVSFYSADFHIGGAGAKVQSKPGIIVTGGLSDIDLTQWQPYFNQITEEHAGDNSVEFTPRLFDVTFGKIDLLGQKLTNTNIKIIPTQTAYDISLNGPQVVGGATIPKSLPKGTIEGHFDKLYLTSPSDKQKSTIPTIGPEMLPGLNLFIHDLRVGTLRLSGLSLQTSPIKNGLTITQLNLASPLLTMNAHGNWIILNKKEVMQKKSVPLFKTNLIGKANTSNLTNLLKEWNLSTGLSANMANAQFNLQWTEAPYQANLQEMSGDMTVNLGSGVISNLSESANNQLLLGKLISALSFQQIFSGFGLLQQKGYTFESAHANIVLNHGNLLLENGYFDGAVARINIQGGVSLVQETMNLQVSVLPNVTGSLPVAAGILTLNPLVGIAAWVANKLIVAPSVGHAAQSNYLVTGAWTKPNIVKQSPITPTSAWTS